MCLEDLYVKTTTKYFFEIVMHDRQTDKTVIRKEHGWYMYVLAIIANGL